MPRPRLPLQTVETVNSPRADRGTLLESSGDDGGDRWRNRLIWGDNLHVLASLADELAGEVDLVYIDPPFDSRQDYQVRIAVGDGGAAADQDLAKLSSVIEEKAYRDTCYEGPGSSTATIVPWTRSRRSSYATRWAMCCVASKPVRRSPSPSPAAPWPSWDRRAGAVGSADLRSPRSGRARCRGAWKTTWLGSAPN